MKRIPILLVCSLFVSMSQAAVGPGSSGGGTGIFCQPGGSQPAVQLLDFYEGKVLSGYTIQESTLPFQAQVNAIAQLLSFDWSLQIDFAAALRDVYANTKFLPPGVSIHVPNDLGSDEAVPYPTGCILGGIGFYQTDGKLMISTDAFKQMSETQKAGFFVHEALYKVYRHHHALLRDQQLSAAATRRFVANLFANQKTPASLRHWSWPMTWSPLGPAANPNFRPSPGRESAFAYLGDGYSPIHLNRKNFFLRVRISRETGINLYCHDSNGEYLRVDEEPTSHRFEKIWKSIPENCAMLEIGFTDGNSSPGYPMFSVEIDGVEYLTGQNDSPLDTSGIRRKYVQLIPYYF